MRILQEDVTMFAPSIVVEKLEFRVQYDFSWKCWSRAARNSAV